MQADSFETGQPFRLGYRVADLDRSALYLELLPSLNAGAVELPDDARLLRELRGLERRRGSAGRDRVDHRPGEHDDRANAVAGVVALLGRPRPTWGVVDSRRPEPDDGFRSIAEWRPVYRGTAFS
jgi:hypothetical protein